MKLSLLVNTINGQGLYKNEKLTDSVLVLYLRTILIGTTFSIVYL